MPADLSTPGVSEPGFARLVVQRGARGVTVLLEGRLDAVRAGDLWRHLDAELPTGRPEGLVVDASRVDYCDGVGAGLFVELERRQRAAGGELELRGLPEQVAHLLELFGDLPTSGKAAGPRSSFVADIGKSSVGMARDLRQLVAFVGEAGAALGHAALHPRSVRWRDVVRIAEEAGVRAVPIVVLINFLMGLIMAFEASQALALFGAEVFVANLVALSTLRELGPLMTAILLAGRSGSAFAAELGTMKVSEELDALTTMGLDPVRFLAITRILAGVLVMPILTLFANLAALAGGCVVFVGLGYPVVTYIGQVQEATGLHDLGAGLAKAFVFGILVAGIGCLRGLQTGGGPSAVGESATRSVVSGVFLIIVADAIFSFAYHWLGI